MRPTLVAAFVIVFVPLAVSYGFWRTLVGLGMASVIAWLGWSYFRAAGEVPPEPEDVAAQQAEHRFVCSVCGLALVVESGSIEKPPTHCREKMELRTTGAPLRPV